MTVKRRAKSKAEDHTPVRAPTEYPSTKLGPALAMLVDAFPGSVLDGDQAERSPCSYPMDVIVCESPGAGIVCKSCCLLELGEGWENLAARTNAGETKARFYKKLADAQARPDADYGRMIARQRERERRG